MVLRCAFAGDSGTATPMVQAPARNGPRLRQVRPLSRASSNDWAKAWEASRTARQALSRIRDLVIESHVSRAGYGSQTAIGIRLGISAVRAGRRLVGAFTSGDNTTNPN